MTPIGGAETYADSVIVDAMPIMAPFKNRAFGRRVNGLYSFWAACTIQTPSIGEGIAHPEIIALNQFFLHAGVTMSNAGKLKKIAIVNIMYSIRICSINILDIADNGIETIGTTRTFYKCLR